jgi:hypothetical protein
MAVQYEQQEGARRAAEWDARGVIDPEDIPGQMLPFVEEYVGNN